MGISLIKLWVAFLVCCNLLGWGLSTVGALNRYGYLIGFLVFAGLMLQNLQTGFRSENCRFRWGVVRKRFSRFLPLVFALLWLAAFVGGMSFPPNNYDALSYRIPRILHWLAEGGWHWIPTNYAALNTRTSGIEWISAPLLLFTHSDRFLFLINSISYALMPGMVFGLLLRLGVRRGVAWSWMWIFPTGYCYLLQAGSIGNDLFGTTTSLAAFYFAVKYRSSGMFQDIAYSILAISLTTGAKFSNIPLVLPWFVLAFPGAVVALKYPVRVALVCFAGAVCSFLPNAVLNQLNCGDWTGLVIEKVHLVGGAPLLYVGWNIPYLIIQNLSPPVFPFTNQWTAFLGSVIPPAFQMTLLRHFEPAAAMWEIGEMQTEEGAGLGFGLTVILILSLAYGVLARRSQILPTKIRSTWLVYAVFLAACCAAAPMLAKSGLSGSARYFAPYYLLLILPIFLVPSALRFLRSKFFWVVFGIHAVVCLGLVALSPARPLSPVESFVRASVKPDSSNPMVQRILGVYSTYRERNSAFQPVRDAIPPDTKVIGLFSSNTLEASLWKPYGSIRVKHILPTQTASDLREQGIEYAVAGVFMLKGIGFPDLDEWAASREATPVAKVEVTMLNRVGPRPWVILRLDPPRMMLDKLLPGEALQTP